MPRRVLLLLLVCAGLGRADDLSDGFRQPPPGARPQVWWHWLNGNVTPAGITADLEAMRRVGLGGGTIANIPFANVGDAPFNSPAWQAAVKHAASEAQRLGLELGLFNCEGWSSSGGPWITPDDAMQMLVWNQRRGGLPAQPLTRLNTYHDIALLAFPTPPEDRLPSLRTLGAKADVELAPACDGDPATFITLAKASKPSLTLEFAQPFVAGGLRLVPGPRWVRGEGLLEVSDDGREYRTVRRFALPQSGEVTDAGCDWLVDERFAPASGRWFRLTCEPRRGGGRPMEIAELDLLPPAPVTPLDPTRLLDLTGQSSPSLPAGDWTWLRLGYTPIGKQNHPATRFGVGLECDKLSRPALEHDFRDGLDPLLKALGPLAGQSLRYLLIDSYECGEQNWTAALPAEFAARRGYALTGWLPALAGRTVGSAALSRRFVDDFRRTLADLWDANYYGAFAALCHARGLRSSVEAYGCSLFDELRCAGQNDMPMSEFWFGHGDETSGAKHAASAAHTYGRPLVGAESFTSGAEWNFDPASMKAQGDAIFAAGVNRYYFHSSAGQPQVEHRGPGFAWGNGIHLTRNLTWFEQSRAWLGYLGRCEYLLQAGQSCADVLSFDGDFNGSRATRSLPAGYDFDALDAHLLRDDLRVEGGRLRLASGTSYRLLLLPSQTTIALPTLRRVAELVRAGAVVCGPRPTQAYGLSGYPASDAEVGRLAAELWGPIDGRAVIRHDVGAGRVYWTGSATKLQPVFDDLGLLPDLATSRPEDGLRWLHRRDGDRDWYFLANPDRRRTSTTVTFRVAGRLPELWQPETGELRPAPAWRNLADGWVAVPLTCESTGSVFVVFRAPQPAASPLTDFAAALPVPPHTLTLQRATYAASDGTGKSVDLTAKLAPLLAAGGVVPRVDNEFAGGDPAPLHVKQLKLEYTLDGVPGVTVLGENARVRLPLVEPDDLRPGWDLALDATGRPRATAWRSGEFRFGDAAAQHVEVPEPRVLAGPWTVAFDPRWGGPAEPVTCDRLFDWTARAEPGIRYYSGTAVYSTEFDLPADWLTRPLCLDLGGLANLAEVALNGRELGVVWKAPWRVDPAGALVAGRNRLVVRVTNNWANRLIGDKGLPAAQRVAFTTTNPYKWDTPLQPSGLWGPVVLRVGVSLAPGR